MLLQAGYVVKAFVNPSICLDHLESLELEIITSDLNSSQLPQLIQKCQFLFHLATHYGAKVDVGLNQIDVRDISQGHFVLFVI